MRAYLLKFFSVSVACIVAGLYPGLLAQRAPLQTFPLSAVQLLESPFKHAQDVDARYILSLDADRLLAPFLKDAGLKPLKENYGNWESDGLDGHTAGHYITAVAQMYAATGDKVFDDKLRYVLGWLQKCQQANGNGYVGGVPGGKELWPEIAKGNVAIIWKRWVPWYNLHKTYSGLVDAWLLTGNQQARQVLMKLGEWCMQLTANLTDAQMQQMLDSEHGGMNEAFANMAEITGDKRYLALADRFSHRAILNPLLAHQDSLTGLHANTQIPKVVGFMRYATVAKKAAWADASDFFWNTVVKNRSISIGGNSVREHFNPVQDFSPMLDSREGPETCNSYNMLKLTRQLFLTAPGANYMDYYERTVYNHILSSQHPEGGFVYFTPIHPQHYRVYSTSQQSFWCCVGSGIENHGKYGELIYAHDAANLYINLFIPSELHWKEKGIRVVQTTRFPQSETTTLKLQMAGSQKLGIKIRKPLWVAEGFRVLVNGTVQRVTAGDNSYVTINRVWKNGDVITIHLPMRTTVEHLPDQSKWISFVHGPIVLAAVTDTSRLQGLKANGSRWGHIAGGPLFPADEAPLLVLDDKNKLDGIKTLDKTALSFSISSLVYQEKFKQLKLVPFYQVHDARYMLYWPYTTKELLPTLLKEMKEQEAAKQQLDIATIDMVYPGEQQPEADHQFKGETTRTGSFREKKYRDGRGWFSYTLQNPQKNASKLSVMYYGTDKNKKFDVLLNDSVVTTVELSGNEGTAFLNRYITIPGSVKNADKITVKFQAAGNGAIAPLFEVRLLK
jgi:DUF1680 family protein